MTPELAQASYEGMPPFHGDTCVVRNLDLPQLWECYRIAVALVSALGEHDMVWENQDWHWRDGAISKPRLLPFEKWSGWLSSPETLEEAWRAQDYCHRTVYPPDMQWCLRFHLWEELEEHPSDLGIDFSGEPNLVEAFSKAILEQHKVHSEVLGCKKWFLDSGQTRTTPTYIQWYLDRGWGHHPNPAGHLIDDPG